MKSCRELDALLTRYVDGEITSDQCAAIEAHLAACPPCRDCAEAEATARRVVRGCRDRLREPAPAALHEACRKLARDASAGSRSPARAAALAGLGTPPAGEGRAAGRARTTGTGRSSWRSWGAISVAAATLVLAVAGVVLFGLVSERSTALAAQLATDHLKCIRLVAGGPPADRAAMMERWQRARGWAAAIPASSATDDVAFVALRRCLYSRGEIAHALYRHKGRLVSLFVFREASQRPANIEIMGQRAAIWRHGDRSYAVVVDGTAADVDHVVAFFKRALD